MDKSKRLFLKSKRLFPLAVAPDPAGGSNCLLKYYFNYSIYWWTRKNIIWTGKQIDFKTTTINYYCYKTSSYFISVTLYWEGKRIYKKRINYKNYRFSKQKEIS
uniref:ribosomal protein S18 n=1 Tax=Tetraena simplex TaxID=2499693 RepID=UPI00223871E4|nr:ribosomal protein S18 [Tetraena simplex]UYC29918.1 ribosomal protein S18 [Tetraena simplex]